MKKYIFLSAFTIISLVTHGVEAAVGPVPYVTGITTGPNGGNHYQAVVNYNMTTGVADLDTKLGADGQIILAFCGKFAEAYLSVCISPEQFPVTADMTWRDASDEFIRRYGNSGSSTINGEGTLYSPDLCAGVGFSTDNSGAYVHQIPTWFPGTTCTLAPPETYECSQTFDKTAINFGTVKSKDIDNTSTTVKLTTSCNGVGTVTVTPAWNGLLQMNGPSGEPDGIYVDTFVDGKQLNNDFSFPSKVGSVNHDIEFKLSLDKTATLEFGIHKATAVFIFSYV